MRNYTVFIITLIIFVIGIPLISADLNSISKSNTLFVGEENLNLAGAEISSNEKIGYWSPGTHVKTDSPDKIVTISDPKSFYVDPAIFKDRTGPWYTVNDRNLAFYVERPQITLRLYDTTANFDATGKWVPKGDQITFRIETNLYQMKERVGVMGAPISIKIKNSNGTEYNSLTTSNGDSIRLTDMLVTDSPFTMPVVWNTAGFQSGDYIVWAECNANKMLDNYNVIGETVSNDENTPVLLIQDKNPLIGQETKGSNELSVGVSSTVNDSQTTNFPGNSTKISTTTLIPANITNATLRANESVANISQVNVTSIQTSNPIEVQVTTVSTTTVATPATTKAGSFAYVSVILAIFGLGFSIYRRKE